MKLYLKRNGTATDSSVVVGQRECWQNEHRSTVAKSKVENGTWFIDWWCWSKTLLIWIEIQDIFQMIFVVRFQRLPQWNDCLNYESMISVVNNRWYTKNEYMFVQKNKTKLTKKNNEISMHHIHSSCRQDVCLWLLSIYQILTLQTWTFGCIK